MSLSGGAWKIDWMQQACGRWRARGMQGKRMKQWSEAENEMRREQELEQVACSVHNFIQSAAACLSWTASLLKEAPLPSTLAKLLKQLTPSLAGSFSFLLKLSLSR